MAEASAQASRAPRALGGWGIAFIAFNAIIGAGIFGLPGKLDSAVGGFAPWLILFAGLAMMLIALCYADLATRFDSSGGPQLFADAAFGEFVGFQTGWMYWAARVAGSAANATVLGAYAATVFPHASPTLIAVAAVALVTLLNLASLGRVVATLGLLSPFKLIPLLVVCAAALLTFGPPAMAAPPSFGAAGGVALVAIYAFVGFEAATLTAGETRDPKRAIPQALIGTLALVTAVYVLVQLAYSGSALGESDTPLADLATLTIGPWGQLLIVATAVGSIFANLSCALTSLPRITAAMAERRQLPDVFAKRFANGSPYVSVCLFGGVAIALAASGTFVFLVVVGTLARLFTYALSALAIPALDRRAGAGPRWIRGILLPAAATLFCLWAASQSGSDEWLTFAGFFAAGAMLYGLARWAVR